MSEVVLARRQPVEVDCRPARWSRVNSRYIRSILNLALVDAENYLTEVLGITTTHQRVMPYMSYLGKKSKNVRAFTQSESVFYILLTGNEVKNRKLEFMYRELASVCAHEMVHCARLKQYPSLQNLDERVVSEGLAYTAQAYLESDVFDVPMEDTVLEDEVEIEPLLEELASDIVNWDDSVLENWMYDEKGNAFSWGDRLGVQCVRYWLEEYGTDFPTLLSMPAQEVLSIS